MQTPTLLTQIKKRLADAKSPPKTILGDPADLINIRPMESVVFTFGRFNVPTVAHKKLVDSIKEEAVKRKCDHFVFVSHSQDEKRNPLPYDLKLEHMDRMFPNTNIYAADDVHDIIDAIKLLESKGYNDVILMVGSDRVNEFQKLIEKYNHSEFELKNFTVLSVGKRDPDAEGIEGISASKMRGYVAEGNFEAFKQGVPDEDQAYELFNDTRFYMGLEELVDLKTPRYKESLHKIRRNGLTHVLNHFKEPQHHGSSVFFHTVYKGDTKIGHTEVGRDYHSAAKRYKDRIYPKPKPKPAAKKKKSVKEEVQLDEGKNPNVRYGRVVNKAKNKIRTLKQAAKRKLHRVNTNRKLNTSRKKIKAIKKSTSHLLKHRLSEVVYQTIKKSKEKTPPPQQGLSSYESTNLTNNPIWKRKPFVSPIDKDQIQKDRRIKLFTTFIEDSDTYSQQNTAATSPTTVMRRNKKPNVNNSMV